MRNKIQDQYTNLPVSRQRKWQLRNPDKDKAIKKRYRDKKNDRANLPKVSSKN